MPTRRFAVLLALAALALLANGYWVAMGRPATPADAHAARMACVSYAPYRQPGESPFDARFSVSAARIDADLATLAERFDCVRTYSVSAGLDQVPALAERHGMKVLLGIWLSRNGPDNERELARGIALANAHRAVVEAVIVGNEVLLRGELPQESLAALIERVKDATGLPVTYADVWEFWLKYPKVARAVSFVTIHILPYWEDDPVPIEAAVAHVAAIRAQMQRAFPDRDVLIGETGWPSEGRQRSGALPSVVNQARFFREFLNWAGPAQVRYNLIEAFDQPWKRELEGTVGGYWGLYDRDKREKFPLSGAVVEEPRWASGVAAGLVLALAALAAGLARLRLRLWGCAVLALGADAAGATLWGEWRQLGFASRTAPEWLTGGALALLALVTATLLALELARWADGRRTLAAPASLVPLRRGGWAEALGVLQFTWLFCIAIVNLLLVFDARYRDFPLLLFAAPVAAYLVHALAMGGAAQRGAPRAGLEERWLAGWAIASGAIIMVMETPANGSADRWVLLCALFGASVLWRRQRARLARAP